MTDKTKDPGTTLAGGEAAAKGVRTLTKNGMRVQKWGKGKTVAAALVISLAVSLAAALGVGVYAAYFYDNIYSGVSVRGVDLSGKTPEQARALIENDYSTQPETSSFVLGIGERAFNIEITQSDLGYDSAHTAELARLYGREGGFMTRLGDILRAMRNGVDLAPAYSINERSLELKAEEIARDIAQETIAGSYDFDGKALVVDRGQMGFMVDEQKLADFLKTKVRAGNFLDATFEPEIREPDELDLALIKANVEKEMREPRLDLENDPTGQTVLPGQTGLYMDLQKARAALEATDERFVELPVEITRPQYSTEEFKALLFRDVLAEGTTEFNAGLKGRTTNVLLANSLVNGKIIGPGEVFSYNDTVGPRTYERGFMDAIVYVGTSAEDGVGGGICQVSSTIYYATLRADLEIVERRSHSRMVVYVPLGEDATVAWGSTDYQFRNNTDFPIKIVATNTRNTITIQIVGTQLIANKEVKLETKRLSHTPFETVYVIDPELPVGTEKVDQSGYTGYRTETYRVVYIDGVEVSRTFENKSAYTKYDKVIKHNPPPSATEPVDSTVPADPTAPGDTTLPPATEPPQTTAPQVTDPQPTEPVATEPPATTAPPSTEGENSDPPINFEDDE